MGDTVEQIAKEKAGIIKKNIPIYVFEQDKKIIEIIKKKSVENKAPLSIIKSEDVEVIKTNL